jgi:molybdenum cofactor synthesis domain-containing protein
MTIRVGILTVSDRSAQGLREDASGPALIEAVANQGWQVVKTLITPDDREQISQALSTWCDSHELDLILTTGGTGFSPRDQTPEATQDIIERPAPGLAEAMRAASLHITPHAMLSRAIAGIRCKTLIINLPGSPKAAIENLQVVIPVIPHAVQLLISDPNAEKEHHKLPGTLQS